MGLPVEYSKLNQEWIELSAAWIEEARHGRNPTRKGLLDKPMLEACGNVRGMKVLGFIVYVLRREK